MADKKSILAEALLDIKNIQNALNANTKEIFRSVAREEIDSVVKESLLAEVDYEEEDLEKTNDTGLDAGSADAATDDITGDLGGDELNLDANNDIENPEEVGPEMEPEIGMDADALGGEETMDMTAASDDDVIAIYKKLSGEDEIEIVGDEIHMNISEPGEYIVKATDTPLGDETASTDELIPVSTGDDETGEEGGVDYEIEMGDEEGGNDEGPSTDGLVPADEEGEEESGEEDELDENLAQTRGSEKHAGKYTGASKFPSKLDEAVSKLVSEEKKKYNTLLTETKKLKSENEEFRKALKEFRTKLIETLVFNSNLTYTTKLFMEHSTTKDEKQNIFKRFDNEVTNLIESKKLYKTIANELGKRKPISESIENKIIKEVSTGVSKQLTENTAYVDPSTKRIMDLINRVEKR